MFKSLYIVECECIGGPLLTFTFHFISLLSK